ncbi:hypothetical protein OAL09_08190 [Verrucomicrobia bacterium]|nr:hypothetical protein [Verrucomicrobiota bacterium]
MRTLLISLILSGIASAQVPSLINYQGKLTNAEGEPLTGTKNFELKIFDAQTEGNLLYTETFDSVTLGEGGVYNFLFGEAGTSNAQVTETVGNGNGENLYQKILSNENIVDGTISVTDGTYTWSQESGSSNEDDFSASYSKNLKRITVNYFAGAPDDGRNITVTYRHQKTGITGALTGGAEQWMELTVDGETQTTRQRIGAVPYALKAGSVDETARRKAVKKYIYGKEHARDSVFSDHFLMHGDKALNYKFILPDRAKKIIKVSFELKRVSESNGSPPEVVLSTFDESAGGSFTQSMKNIKSIRLDKIETAGAKGKVYLPLNWNLEDEAEHYEIRVMLGGTSHAFSSPLLLEYEY